MLGPRHMLTALVLLAATGVAILPAVRYRRVEPELASVDGLPAWSLSTCGAHTAAGGSGVALAADERCRQPWAALELPAAHDWSAVSVGVRVAAQELRFGPAGWQRPLVEVAALDAAGSLVDRAVVVVPVAAGSAGLPHWTRVLRVPHAAVAIRVRFILAATAGTLELDRIELRGIAGRQVFPWLRAGLAIAWLAWFGVTARAWLRSCRRRLVAALAVAVVLTLATGAVLSRAAILELAGLVAAGFTPVAVPAASNPDHGADQSAGHVTAADPPANRIARVLEREWRAGRLANAGHVAGFLVLTVALGLASPRGGLRVVVAAVLVVALATELLQGLGVSRTPRAGDVGLDLAGALLGLLALLAVGRRRDPQTSGMSVPKT